MTTIFYNYLAKLLATPDDQLSEKRSAKWLEKIENKLKEDEKKPVEKRSINSPPANHHSMGYMTPLQKALEESGELFSSAYRSAKRPLLEKLIKLYLKYSDLTIQGPYGHA